MKFPCPNCEQNLEIGDDLVGSSFPCPSCGKSIHIEVQEEGDLSEDEYADFSCAHCDGIIRTSKSADGTEINCPHCDEITVLALGDELEEEYDPFKAKETEARIEELKPKKKEKRVIPEYAFGHRQIIGLVGGIILFIGVFLPIAKIPILGTINLFMGGVGNGIFIFFFAIISLLATMFKKERLQMLMGLLSLGILTFSFGTYLSHISTMRMSQSDFSQIASNFITLEWGWAILVVSCGMLIVPAFIKEKPINGGDNFFVLSKAWRIFAISISSIYGSLIIASIFFGIFDFAKIQTGNAASNLLNEKKPETSHESRYNFSENIDPIHRTKSYFFVILENAPINKYDTLSQHRYIGIMHDNERGTQIGFMPKSLEWLDTDLSTSASVTVRLDGQIIEGDWAKSSKAGSNMVIYPGKKKLFIERLLKAKELVIRINQQSQSDITAVFDLTGFDEAFEPMKKILGM